MRTQGVQGCSKSPGGPANVAALDETFKKAPESRKKLRQQKEREL
jgi:hypothetical protein